MSEDIERTRVSFDSGGVELAGCYYRPADATAKLPYVVMGHGFSGIQDRLFGGAERLGGVGFATLTFDYRNFGESGGEPRQVIDIEGQRGYWRAAVSWARSRPEIDPDGVALWGTSLGGTHTIFVAAGDHRIAAVVAQIPYAVEAYESGRWIRFRFAAPHGFDGFHEFTVHPRDPGVTELHHLLAMRLRFPAWATYPLLWRPLHDALLEDTLNRAERSLTGTVRLPARWSRYVRLQRKLLARARTRQRRAGIDPPDARYRVEGGREGARYGNVRGHSEEEER